MGTGSSGCPLARIAHGDPGTLLVVAAHPDDETVGVGATLGALASVGWRIEVLHVTDGAPRAASLRPALREASLVEAAAVRREEARAALRAGGLDPERTLARSLEVPDQEAAHVMAPLARVLATRLASVDIVVTHPYEGGHPDHDAVAFAVHGAAALHLGVGPPIVEMSSYHRREGKLETGAFLARPSGTCFRPGVLDAAARGRRGAMLDAFTTQREVLAAFGLHAEPLRCAPAYDFTRAPHDGVLHYETLPFGWTGPAWRELARAALRELGITPPALEERRDSASRECRS